MYMDDMYGIKSMAQCVYIVDCIGIGWRTAGARFGASGNQSSGSFHMRREQPSLFSGLSSPQRRLSKRRDNQHHCELIGLRYPF